jgi:hypothetical protein
MRGVLTIYARADGHPNLELLKNLVAIGSVINHTVRSQGSRRSALLLFEQETLASEIRRGCARSLVDQEQSALAKTCRDEQSRIRNSRADANFRSLRRMALSLLKNNDARKIGGKHERLSAG